MPLVQCESYYVSLHEEDASRKKLCHSPLAGTNAHRQCVCTWGGILTCDASPPPSLPPSSPPAPPLSPANIVSPPPPGFVDTRIPAAGVQVMEGGLGHEMTFCLRPGMEGVRSVTDVPGATTPMRHQQIAAQCCSLLTRQPVPSHVDLGSERLQSRLCCRCECKRGAIHHPDDICADRREVCEPWPSALRSVMQG